MSSEIKPNLFIIPQTFKQKNEIELCEGWNSSSAYSYSEISPRSFKMDFSGLSRKFAKSLGLKIRCILFLPFISFTSKTSVSIPIVERTCFTRGLWRANQDILERSSVRSSLMEIPLKSGTSLAFVRAASRSSSFLLRMTKRQMMELGADGFLDFTLWDTLMSSLCTATPNFCERFITILSVHSSFISFTPVIRTFSLLEYCSCLSLSSLLLISLATICSHKSLFSFLRSSISWCANVRLVQLPYYWCLCHSLAT